MKQITLLWVLASFMLIGCAPAEPGQLTVMTHDSFSVSEKLIRTFEQVEQVQVRFLTSGDAGAVLNKAILTRDAPLADVMFGVDNTFLSRALNADIFEPYFSPVLSQISPEFQLDPSMRLTPVDFGDVCINFDKAYFSRQALPVPETLEDLLRPEYRGLFVTPNPATSSPGLAFLLATVKHFGDPGYLDFWAGLRDNGLVVVGDWETAYYTNFSASSGRGLQPLVVSYATSPPAEVVFAEVEMTEAPTASIVGPQTCFRQIEFVGILKGTRERALAEKFVDFLLSEPFQEDVPLQMFVFPVNSRAVLPEAFVQFAQVPEQPAEMSPAEIAQNRDAWIAAWTETVLR
jgi:thiamine transport system substrate-binding protein